MFTKQSRYHQVPEDFVTDAAGRRIPYKLLRLISSGRSVQAHRVAIGDRLDLIAFHYLNDPEQFWRICDANLAIDPEDLLAPGVQLNIPVPGT
jgi:nucleoid-associated protein YgaU